MNKSKNLFLGFIFTLLILVSITAISATDTNSTSTQTDVQDVATQAVEPVKKVTSTQVTKTQEKTDNKIKTTTKENKKETTTKTTTKKQDTTNTKNTTTNSKTVKTTTKSLKEDGTSESFSALGSDITTATSEGTLTLQNDYTRTASSEARISISNPITINGNGHTIDANNGNGVFVISADTVLANMTIKNNKGSYSAIEIRNTGSLTLNNVTFENNNRTGTSKTYGGAAIYHTGTSLTIDNCTFNNNTAPYGGAIAINKGNNTELTNVIFSNNNISYYSGMGGAIYQYSYQSNGKLSLTNVNFTNNTATYSGGAISSNQNSNVNMTNVTFTNNAATTYATADGGALHIDQCNMTITNGEFKNNYAKEYGGAINIAYGSNATITNITCTNNTATYGVISVRGGSTYNNYQCEVSLYNSTIEKNTVPHIIYLLDYAGPLDIQNSSFINNDCNHTFFNESIAESAISKMYNNTFIGNSLNAEMSANPTEIVDRKGATITVQPITTLWNTTVTGGKIDLYKDGDYYQTIDVNENGIATLGTEDGEYELTLKYSNQDNNFTAEDITIPVNIPKPVSKITAEALNTTATNVTIKATVTNEEDNPITSGTVIVTIDGSEVEVGRGDVGSDGTVTITTNIDRYGSKKLNVTYESTYYATSTNTLDVSITKMPTKLTVNTENRTYGNTSVNVFLKTQDDEAVKNAKLYYYLDDSTSYSDTALTDEEGKANIHLDLTAKQNHKILVRFGSIGEGNNTYDASSDTIEFYVEQGTSYIGIETLNNKTTNTTIKVTVTNCTNQPITGQVEVKDITANLESDGTAVITIPFDKFNQAGDNVFTVNYLGNENYTTKINTTKINVRQVNTIITFDSPSTGNVGKEMTISGKIEDEDGNPVSGYYDMEIPHGSSVEVTYLDNGIFKTTFTPTTDNIGKNKIQVYFFGDYKEYDIKSKTNKSYAMQEVYVADPTTKLTINVTDNIKVGDEVSVNVTLTDSLNNPIANQDITITINGQENKVTTNDNGIANTTYQTTRTGALIIEAIYNGNDTYNPKTETKTVFVTNFQTTISLDDITTKINETQTLTITVKDERNNNVNGGKIILKLNGKTLRDEKGNIIYTTVNDGTATVDVKFNQKAGTYTITAVYGGYSYYESSRNKNIKLTVTLRDAQLNFEDVKPTVIGDKISFKVKITDNNTPVNGGKVNIKINGKSLRDNNGNVIYATVNNGIANIEFTLPDTFQAKTYTLTAVYGDSSYNRAENTTQLTITNPTTIDTNIITTAHTIKSNDSTTNTNITLTNDNTPKAIKI